MSGFASLLEQDIHTLPSFTLDSGRVLKDVPIAYKTWGKLNENRDNVMIICHAFTGSADVEDWWGPLMGKGKAFDPNRYFIFCGNVLGSPYGSASPVTVNPDTGRRYGPEFPATTIRDDVRLHKHVLDHLGVTSVAVVIGGSMGGMAVLEWPLCTPPGYVRHIIPMATSARHSAWCISWGEAQRQSIYSDPSYEDGYYSSQPASGLAAARMAALLTYRSRDSFESRFGRKPQPRPAAVNNHYNSYGVSCHPQQASNNSSLLTPPHSPQVIAEMLAEHNDGCRNAKPRSVGGSTSTSRSLSPAPQPVVATTTTATTPKSPPQIFSAQSYLRYQGDKFTARFDANCYIHITRKLDTHDVSRGRLSSPSLSSSFEEEDEPTVLARVLNTLPPRALVIGVQTDGLFTPNEQKELADHIPGAELVIIPSPEGHDGFLLEFELINGHIMGFLKREFPELYVVGDHSDDDRPEDGFEIKKTSLFGEAEADVARW